MISGHEAIKQELDEYCNIFPIRRRYEIIAIPEEKEPADAGANYHIEKWLHLQMHFLLKFLFLSKSLL